MNKKLAFIAASTALLSASHSADAELRNLKKEQCYCIAKAGHNDCANSTGTHQCATYSTTDEDCAEWVLVPAGTCERIVGGSLEPGK